MAAAVCRCLVVVIPVVGEVGASKLDVAMVLYAHCLSEYCLMPQFCTLCSCAGRLYGGPAVTGCCCWVVQCHTLCAKGCASGY